MQAALRWAVVVAYLCLVGGAAHAATLVVTNDSAIEDGVCDSDCSLSDALAVANQQGEPTSISVPAGTYPLRIAAAIFFSRGVSGLVRMKQAKDQPANFASPQLNSVRPTELPVPRTGELMTPVPSVTEGTTRHLGAEAQTRHFDSH